MSRTLTTLGITAGTILVLTGCAFGSDSGGDADAGSDQTVAEACQVVTETIQSAVVDFEEGMSEDPAVAREALDEAAAELEGISDEVTNPEIAEILPDLQAGFAAMGEAIEAMSSGDVSQMEAMGEQFEESFTTFQELCLS
ncbi:hypothetical protein M4I32_04160 [Microbacterium sp. LRZ72]|uniref:hypothetical protein n=1 Tax=Microbacterium sp. LRZ72 TaxID=2942481 RepID=UPI0029A7192A|nr:hypothetical protein [Microbacterium sp. LRZ72]MDX2375989.1 hypothetical protein [Microbacterium sp. LRZ72]